MKYLLMLMTGALLVINPSCDDPCPCGYVQEPYFELSNRTSYEAEVILINHKEELHFTARPNTTNAIPVDMSMNLMSYRIVINGDTSILRMEYAFSVSECDEQALLQYDFANFSKSEIPLFEVGTGEGMYCYNHWAMPEFTEQELKTCKNGNLPTPPVFVLGYK
ncbi:MAG: hypothetical protein KDC76_12545 [Bacteroidetes bacterium]|nr:hypothetical protein [Bacteroidota bacterium]